MPNSIATVLRDRILRAELRPGDRIVEGSVAKELKVGQPSVREALFVLEREGLVKRVANLGTFVTELDLRDVGNLYQIRAELEGLAAELAAKRSRPEERRDLVRLAEDMRRATLEAGRSGFFAADLAFHRRLWQLSGNSQLAELLEPVVVPLFVVSYLQLDRTTEELLESAADHAAIAEAVSAGPAMARQSIQVNMRRFLNRHFSQFLNGILEEPSAATMRDLNSTMEPAMRLGSRGKNP